MEERPKGWIPHDRAREVLKSELGMERRQATKKRRGHEKRATTITRVGSEETIERGRKTFAAKIA